MSQERRGEYGSLDILCYFLGGELACLVEFAAVSRGDAEPLAGVQEALAELGVICGIVAVEERLVAALDNEAGDVHAG